MVVRQLGDHALRVVGVELLEPLGDAQVQARARRGGQALVGGLLVERVREAPGRRGAGHCLDHARALGLVEQVERLLARDARDARHQRHGELAPDRRRRRDQLGTGLRERVERAADEVDGVAGQLDAAADAALDVRELAALAQQPDRLAQVERHALGAREQLRGDLGRRAPPDRRAQQLADLGAREAAQRDLRAALLLAQQRQGAVQRMAALARLLAHGAEDQQRIARRLEDEVFEQAQRRRARPLQVVEHDQQRAPAAGARERARHGVEEEEAALLGRDTRVRRRRARRARARARRARPRPRPARAASAPSAGSASSWRSTCAKSQKAGTPSPSRARATSAIGPRARHLRREHLAEPRLADARRTADERDAAAPGLGLRERLAQRAERLFAPDEGRGAARRRRRRRGARRRAALDRGHLAREAIAAPRHALRAAGPCASRRWRGARG